MKPAQFCQLSIGLVSFHWAGFIGLKPADWTGFVGNQPIGPLKPAKLAGFILGNAQGSFSIPKRLRQHSRY